MSSRLLDSDQARGAGLVDRLATGLGAKLLENGAHMPAGSVPADEEGLRNLAIGLPGGHEPEHLHLAARQTMTGWTWRRRNRPFRRHRLRCGHRLRQRESSPFGPGGSEGFLA